MTLANWISLIVGLVGGGVGAWMGMKVGIAVLEYKMADVRADIRVLTKRSLSLNEDSLIHDLEIGTVMSKLEMPRQNRQRSREWE